MLHCGVGRCSSFQILKAGRNQNHGFYKGIGGGLWWIEGTKEFCFQTTLGYASNHMSMWGHIRRSHLWRSQRKGSTPSQSTLFANPKVGGRLILEMAPNLEGSPISQIETRSMAIVHCGDTTCLRNHFLEKYYNWNHGKEKVIRGGRWWIAGSKVVWFQTAFGGPAIKFSYSVLSKRSTWTPPDH